MSTKKKPCIVTIYRNLSVEIDKPGAPVPYKIVDPKTKKEKRYSRKDAAMRGALRNLKAMGEVVGFFGTSFRVPFDSPHYIKLAYYTPTGTPIKFVFNKKK